MKLSIRDKQNILKTMKELEIEMNVNYSGCDDELLELNPYEGMWDKLKEMIENG